MALLKKIRVIFFLSKICKQQEPMWAQFWPFLAPQMLSEVLKECMRFIKVYTYGESMKIIWICRLNILIMLPFLLRIPGDQLVTRLVPPIYYKVPISQVKWTCFFLYRNLLRFSLGANFWTKNWLPISSDIRSFLKKGKKQHALFVHLFWFLRCFM